MSLRKTEAWLKKKGFRLEQSPKHSDICFERRRVRVASNQTRSAQVYTALHECGHLLIHLCRKKLKTRVVAGASYRTWWKLQRSSSKHAQLLSVQEEMVAWDRGVRLAQRLKIPVKKRELLYQRTRSLMTYVRATSRRRRSS